MNINAPMINADMVRQEIADTMFWRPEGTNTVVCAIKSKVGQVFIGEAHCQPATTYVQEQGEKYSFEMAFNKLFSAEVYRLRCELQMLETASADITNPQ